jgi:Tol biopolymer transport system component
MRTAPIFVAMVCTLAITGCGSTTQPPAAAPTTAPTATVGQPGLGDGGRIAVALKNGSNAGIITVNADGSDQRQLTDGSAFDACPDIGSGGALIAFCSNRSGVFEIWLMDAAGAHQRQLTKLGGDSTFPDISPDGRRIVFCGSTGSADDHDIWVVNADGTGLAQLTNTVGNDDCDPVWSPDGSKITFDSNRGGSAQLWVMDATGAGAHQVTTGPSAGAELPDWSPDGQHLAYDQGGSVWVMDAAASDPKRLTQAPGSDYGPAWSPKGNEVVYRHLDASNNGTLRIASVQTGQIRAVPITGTGTPLAPSWGPAAA